MRLLLLILGNILAIFLASYYIDGVTLSGGIKNIAFVGLVFSLINFILKPILKLLLGPFILLSFGLFLIVINMGMLWLTDALMPQLAVTGMMALFLATILIGAVNFAVHILVKNNGKTV